MLIYKAFLEAQHIQKLTFSEKMSYEILNVVFPLVKIRCHDENGEEEITVLEDITGESLVSLNDRCEDAYKDWVRDR